jgi:hypothetical protein
MAEVKIPIFGGVFTVDDTGYTASTDDYEIRNGYIDKNRTLHKRPVMRQDGTANPNSDREIKGMYWWNSAEVFICMIMGSGATSVDVYSVPISGTNKYPSTGTHTLIGNIPSVTTAQAEEFRPRFILGQESGAEELFMTVGGGKIYSVDVGLTTLTDVSAANAARTELLTVTDIEFLNTRLLALQKDTQTIFYSNTLGSDFTTNFGSGGAGQFEVESNPDKVQAIIVKGQELVVFGTDTIEFYYNTGDTTVPFARFEGGEINVGLYERGLVVNDDQDFYFIDNRREVKLMRNKSLQTISLPVAEIIDGTSIFDDAFGFLVQHNTKKYIWFNFPNAYLVNGDYIGRTLVFDVALQRWYQWGESNFNYINTTIDELPWMGMDGAAFCDKVGNQFVCDTEIKHFHETTGHSAKERLVATSSSIDLDTHKRKQTHRITGRLIATTDDMQLRWRDTYDSSPESWQTIGGEDTYQYRDITPASGIGTSKLLKEHRFGQYRIRQYQVVHEQGEFHLSDLTEEVEVLGS